MSEKDFLSQFSGTPSKPDSFKEEVRKPVVKNRKPVNKWLLIGLVAGLMVLGIFAYVIFFMPKISVPSFVGESKSDVAAWVKQQGIETSGIIFKEEYDFYSEKDTILSQDVEPGKKVTKKAKLTFGISLGADPNERITVPGLMSMTKSEIQEWSKANKLTGVKIVSSYSDTVDEGNVIKLSNFNEDDFKRSSSLEVTVSKGPKPANVVKVEDFVGKTAIEAETWAKNNGLNFSKSEVYSEKDEPGKVISQAPSKNNEIKTGDAFTVVVSKGKAVYMPDMYEWTGPEITEWCQLNYVIPKELSSIYDYEAAGECIEQYPVKGTLLKSGDKIEYRVSLGKYVILEKVSNYDDLDAVIRSANKKGANVKLDEPIYEYHESLAPGELIGIADRVEIGKSITPTVSKGRNRIMNFLIITNEDVEYWNDLKNRGLVDDSVSSYVVKWEDLQTKNLSEKIARKMIEDEKFENFHFTYKSVPKEDSILIGSVIEAKKTCDDKYKESPSTGELITGTYIGDNWTIEICICDSYSN